MLGQAIIRTSESPWSSPIWIVTKKSNWSERTRKPFPENPVKSKRKIINEANESRSDHVHMDANKTAYIHRETIRDTLRPRYALEQVLQNKDKKLKIMSGNYHNHLPKNLVL